MIYRTHLYREVYTAGDLLDTIQRGIGSYSQALRNKRKGSSRTPETSTKTTFTTESATEQRTLPEEQEEDKDSGYTNTDRTGLTSKDNIQAEMSLTTVDQTALVTAD